MYKHWNGFRKHRFEIFTREQVGTGSEQEDYYGTFKKLVRNSKDSKSDNFQRWPMFLVSCKVYKYSKVQ